MNLFETVEWLKRRGEREDVAVCLAIGLRALILAERAAREGER